MAHGISETAHATSDHDAEHSHPGERVYIKIATILAVITVIEVAIYYLGLSRGVLVTMLVAFSAVKFVTVVGYFMHLKFDDKRLLWIFGASLGMAFAVFIALHVLQDVNSIDYAQDVLTVQEASETGS